MQRGSLAPLQPSVCTSSAHDLQHRDWRQARKRTAEGRFVDDGECEPPSTSAPGPEHSVAGDERVGGSAAPLPTLLARRVTGLRRGREGAREEGEVQELPSVEIGSRLASRGYPYPDSGAPSHLDAQHVFDVFVQPCPQRRGGEGGNEAEQFRGLLGRMQSRSAMSVACDGHPLQG